MTEGALGPLELEGRLHAQREAIARLAALLATMGRADEVWALLDRGGTFRNHQEDPGVLPAEANAVEAAHATEARLLAETARGLYRDLNERRSRRSQT